MAKKQHKKEIEFRHNVGGEVSLEERADGPPRIRGYAAVFYRKNDPGTEFELFKGLVERISPKAFDRALAEGDDVRALFNHDPDNILGRSTAGTLQLRRDKKGLFYEIDAPDTRTGNELRESIARGDITGSSFRFRVEKESFDESGDVVVRTLESVRLVDVGPVTFPAYEGATTGVRSELFDKYSRLGDDGVDREQLLRDLHLDIVSG